MPLHRRSTIKKKIMQIANHKLRLKHCTSFQKVFTAQETGTDMGFGNLATWTDLA